MTDAISRSAALKFLGNLRALKQNNQQLYSSELIDGIMKRVEKIPALDAVPVVRCECCALHGHCAVEDMLILAGFTDGYCRAGKGLSNAVSGARMDGEENAAD